MPYVARIVNGQRRYFWRAGSVWDEDRRLRARIARQRRLDILRKRRAYHAAQMRRISNIYWSLRYTAIRR